MTGERWSRFALAREDLALATDLYQLTMGAVYQAHSPGARGCFELSVRRLPEGRSFLVFAGLEPALEALEDLRFSEEQVAYLEELPPFAGVDAGFFERLRTFRFGGDVWAMEEGTLFFPGEPVLRVCGDLLEAQLVETLLLAILNFQSAIASKAARMRLAAGDGVQLAEFGTRRAHGPQAGLWAARAAYLAGFDATSNVLAGQKMGLPVVGTMAHSFVMAAADERRAFSDYQRTFPEHSIFLVDTYDTLGGVERALDLGVAFDGVRLDSGDLGELARRTRELLDAGGRPEARIFASGDVDEWSIRELRRAAAPIDAYGIGSKLATSADAPYVGGVYKLVEIDRGDGWRPAHKESAGKATYPGRKQVWRSRARRRPVGDTVGLEGYGETDRGEPLLAPVMREGTVIARPSLEAARRHAAEELASLDEGLRRLEPPERPYRVEVATELESLLSRSRRLVEEG